MRKAPEKFVELMVGTVLEPFARLPRAHKLALASTVLLMAAVIGVRNNGDQESLSLPSLNLDRTPVAIPEDAPAPVAEAPQAKALSLPNFEYQIHSGDTLSGIFDHLGVSQAAMYQVLDSDQEILALDTLKPGDTLRFWLGEDNELQKLELRFSLAHQVIFSRVDDSHFEFKKVDIPGTWQSDALGGEINGSFYLSAQKAGLSENDIARISSLFKDKLNFARDLRAGDSFQVVRRSQFVDGEATGDTELAAIRINNRGKELNAFLFSDGSYYDADGQSLARAFLRYPTARHYRVSSPFNPHRHHPVTGRYAPHNGTDFATPSGTPVLATADGVVTRVTNHPYAGKYIVIEHGGKYVSRYLHLSRALVHKGQLVSRGQKIALSGATGRVTGPHLHYELHIAGRPVNPMTAKIPMAASVERKDKPAFEAEVKQLSAQLDQAGQPAA
ncbi:peptidoglycan DD-metalloendopeptidase family protein [Gallaecimonas kandeliae]|uniref:peptidoglycan DD-metalloendopeptidase family protein n=1 Tax=Gallaecimonas kandeliae TaxID=3029055 RepID=UPI002648FDE1|nr:peptidoglycan DD-metalloendopeptidase family protein [Gallaecimonas kandeliae]WKE65154.1 peptidoglycan DD-metalloendopeptidase family protein [Gallaecimonas kandeliae]